MELVTTAEGKSLVIKKEIPFGILKAEHRYKLPDPITSINYGGPKIPADQWHQMMSFFRWVNKEHKSECQARGFIDPIANTVHIWCFPQEEKTGMHTEEIDNDEARAQRLALPNSKDLIYFFTMHHHCECSAFQSGGDATNEVGQDGLHITMGHMQKEVHDIDARFYLDRKKFTPNLSFFWDIGDQARQLIPDNLNGDVAKYQMTRKVELPFPEQWKTNLIKRKFVVSSSTVYRGGLGYDGFGGTGSHYETLMEKVERIGTEVFELFLAKYKFESYVEIIEFLNESPVIQCILDKCTSTMPKFDAIDIRNVLRTMKELMEEELTDPQGGVTAATGEVKESKKQRKRRLKAEKEAREQAAELAQQQAKNNGSDAKNDPTDYVMD